MTTSSSLLQIRADQALRKSPIPALRKLHVEETEQVIILSGSVSTYYLKQLAQETLMPLRGARELQNRVVVASSARNRFSGLISRVTRDTVMAQVEIQAGPHRFVSLLSREAADELGLEAGMLAIAAVKATNVSVEIPKSS